MDQSVTQPGSAQISPGLVEKILRSSLGPGAEIPPFTIESHGEFSNDLADVRLGDGRRLVVKRGRYPWSRARLSNSRRAAGLLHRRTGVVAPRPLELPEELEESAVDAYWRIELPTLYEIWPHLCADERREAMRSLGELTRRVHEVRFPGHGRLPDAGERAIPLSGFLEEEIGERLLPAVAAQWEAGVPLVEFLMEMVPEVARRVGGGGVLLHGDLHTGNVLCRRDARGVRCVGLLDLEAAGSGPGESDLARLSVMHGHLFNMRIEEPWFHWVREGYAEAVDPVLFAYYAAYHLVDLAFYSVVVGHDWHAEQVAAAAGEIVARLRGGREPAAGGQVRSALG